MSATLKTPVFSFFLGIHDGSLFRMGDAGVVERLKATSLLEDLYPDFVDLPHAVVAGEGFVLLMGLFEDLVVLADDLRLFFTFNLILR